MKMNFALFALFGLLAAPAFAGPAVDAKDFKKSVIEPETSTVVPLDEILINSSYVGESRFEGDYQHFGKQDAWSGGVSYAHRIALSDHLYLRIGATYGRFDFGSTGAPVPNHLQSAAASIALEYKVDGKTGFLIETNPGVYFADKVTSETFDAPTNIGLAYPIFGGNRFYLVMGVGLSSMRDYKVFPVLGIDWTISDQWHLKLYGTEPRIVYTPCPDFEFFVGGELAGGSFHVEAKVNKDHDNNGNERFGGDLDYYEYRGNVGFAYRGFKPVTIEVSGGYVFDRTFDFHEQKETVDLEGAPYVQVSLGAAF